MIMLLESDTTDLEKFLTKVAQTTAVYVPLEWRYEACVHLAAIAKAKRGNVDPATVSHPGPQAGGTGA